MLVRSCRSYIARWRASFTPAPTRAVISTDARRPCYSGLHPSPLRRRAIAQRVENHGGAALAHADNMKAMATHIHQLAGDG
jgi:hypothetical protein